MFLADLLQWWYSRGWVWATRYFFVTRTHNVLEFFSVGDMLKTLFAPYRQTYAGRVNGSLGDKLRGFVDRSISRVIGFIARFALIFCAMIALVANFLIAVVAVVLWPVVPATPVLALVLTISGVSSGGL